MPLDPRDTISFEGVHADYTTFAVDGSTITYDATQRGGSAAVGLAVTLSAPRTVALCADGDRVIGKLISVEQDGRANVQDEGYCQLPGGASATLTLGTSIVGALGASSAKGYIRSANSGTAAELIKADGVIVDASDTTAVWVNLD